MSMVLNLVLLGMYVAVAWSLSVVFARELHTMWQADGRKHTAEKAAFVGALMAGVWPVTTAVITLIFGVGYADLTVKRIRRSRWWQRRVKRILDR